MKTIWIATGNAHKAQEFQKILGPQVQVKTLKDLEQPVEIIEDGTSFQENALIKARTLYSLLHEPVISDDSGLVVDGMNGRPGIESARWMGEETSYEIKNQAIIDQVKDTVKTARYVCAIAWIDEKGREHVYEGTCEGLIHDHPTGSNGFGYDPIFYYPPYGTTLADVGEEEKNAISHRGKALTQFMKDWQEQE